MHVLSGKVKIMISCAAVLLFELAEAGRALRVTFALAFHDQFSSTAELLLELKLYESLLEQKALRVITLELNALRVK